MRALRPRTARTLCTSSLMVGSLRHSLVHVLVDIKINLRLKGRGMVGHVVPENILQILSYHKR